MKLILIGFMGSGKSTVAKLLSTTYSAACHEMDDLILADSKRASITEIFKLDGEPHFRALESAVAQRLALEEQAIVSTGGGIVTNPENIVSLKENGGVTIYLRTRFETIQSRIGSDGDRPLFKDLAKAKELFNIRSAKYESAADITVDTDSRTPETITEEIVKRIGRAVQEKKL